MLGKINSEQRYQHKIQQYFPKFRLWFLPGEWSYDVAVFLYSVFFSFWIKGNPVESGRKNAERPKQFAICHSYSHSYGTTDILCWSEQSKCHNNALFEPSSPAHIPRSHNRAAWPPFSNKVILLLSNTFKTPSANNYKEPRPGSHSEGLPQIGRGVSWVAEVNSLRYCGREGGGCL